MAGPEPSGGGLGLSFPADGFLDFPDPVCYRRVSKEGKMSLLFRVFIRRWALSCALALISAMVIPGLAGAGGTGGSAAPAVDPDLVRMSDLAASGWAGPSGPFARDDHYSRPGSGAMGSPAEVNEAGPRLVPGASGFVASIPAFMVDSSIVSALPMTIQGPFDLAFDGTNYFLVWRGGEEGRYDIYGCRVAPDGTVIDTARILIHSAYYPQGLPAVAFDGTNYLVVWHEMRSFNFDIYGTRVSKNGAVLDPDGIAVSTSANDQLDPDVAFDGTNYLVVWADKRGLTWDIYGSRVKTDGTVMDVGFFAKTIAVEQTADQFSPVVSAGAGKFFVAWEDRRNGDSFDIYCTTMTSAGVIESFFGVAVSTADGDQYLPAVSFNGVNFFLTWTDERGGEEDIYGARVSPSRTVLDAGGIPICESPGWQSWSANCAYDTSGTGADGFFVAWADHRTSTTDIYGARMSAAGAVVDSGGFAVAGLALGQYFPEVSFDGTNLMTMWADDRANSGWNVFARRFDQNASAVDGSAKVILSSVNDQGSPVVASDGAEYLVVWVDDRSGSGDIYAALLDTLGVLQGPPFAVCANAAEQSQPTVAFGGGNYLVVWTDKRNLDSDIYAARVSATGQLLDAEPIEVYSGSGWQRRPAVSSNGEVFLVVWEDDRTGFCDLYGAMVSPGGTVTPSAGRFLVSGASNGQTGASIATDGDGFLVVWQDYRGGISLDVYGARIDSDGNLLDTGGIKIASGIGTEQLPAVTFGGSNYLVVWEDDRNDSWDIYGARVSKAGTLMDLHGVRMVRKDAFTRRPRVAFDGSDYVVMWTDFESGTKDVYAVRFDSTVVQVDTAFVAISATGEAEVTPEMALNGTGQFLFCWAAYTDSAFRSTRVWAEIGRWNAFNLLSDRVPAGQVAFGDSYPNPFSSGTAVSFNLKGSCAVRASVFDVQGREVARIADRVFGPGSHVLLWDGSSRSGTKLASGVYFLRIEAGSERTFRKLMILR